MSNPTPATVVLRDIQALFPSPLFTLEVAESGPLNEALLRESMALRVASVGMQRSNLNGWHSDDDFFERQELAFQTLRGHILQALQIATRQVSPRFDFTRFGVQAEGWVNILDTGGLNTPHDHPGWTWSGCYYVAVPKTADQAAAAIEFFDVRTNARVLSVDGADCFASKYQVPPRPGLIVIFPSYLRHWVYPNPAAEARVSIAFNARFVPVSPR